MKRIVNFIVVFDAPTRPAPSGSGHRSPPLIRHRRIGMKQPGLAQIRPQRRRDRMPQQVEIGAEFVGVARPRYDRGDGRMGERELQRGSRQRHGVRIAHRRDRLDPLDDGGRGRVVVPRVAPGEDAGIERPADDDRGAGGDAFRQEIVERRLFEQRIAAGQEEGVPLAPFHRFEKHLALVDTDPDRPDRATVAQAFERPVAAVAQRASARDAPRRHAGTRRCRARRGCRSGPTRAAESCPRRIA